MNKSYRLIWKEALGAFVIVSELAIGRGKRSSGLARSSFGWLLMACLPTLAWAVNVPDTVRPSGSGSQAYVAPNGVPVVDIAKANGQGLSHNKYDRFDVTQQGLVLNNIGANRGNTQSQLAGMLLPNMNLDREAQIILNEVISSRRSTLAGFTEVAGGRADVIVANPYGITCNGCGFINTDRVTLSTGTPVLNVSGALEGFRVSRGDILAINQGINASGQQILDLVARSVKLEGQVNAQQLGITTGANVWSYAGRQVTGAATAEGTAPTLALDTGALGGMYANTIRLVATEAGVGVRMEGEAAASRDDFVLSAAGNIELRNKLSAQRDLKLDSQGSKVLVADGANAASLSAGRELSLQAAGADVTLTGATLTSGQLNLNAASLTDNSSGGKRFAAQSAKLQLSGDVTLQGSQWGSGGTLTIAGNNLSATDSKLYSGSNGQGDLSITSQHALNLTNSQLDAKNALTLDSATLDIRGSQLQAGANASLKFASKLQLDQQSALKATGNLQLQAKVDGASLNNAGTLESGQALQIGTDHGKLAVQNSGQLLADSIQLDDVAALDNVGRIQAAGALTLNAAALSNAKDAVLLSKTGALTLNADSLDNSGAVQGATLNVTVAQALHNRADGKLIAGQGGMALKAGSMDNAGAIDSAAALSLTTTQGDILNQSILQSGGQLTLDAAGSIINNAGALLLSDSGATLTAKGTLDNAGHLQSRQDLSLKAASLSNSGKLLAGNPTQTAALTLDTGSGSVSNSGILQTSGDMTVRAGDITNPGKLIAAGKLDVTAATLDNQQLLQAGQDAKLTFSGDLSNTGTLLTGQALTLQAAALRNQGTLQALGNAKLTLASADNSGKLLVGGTLKLDSQGKLDNRAGAQLIASGATTLLAGSVDNQGQLLSGSTLDATVQGELLNGSAAVLQAEGDLKLQADSLHNQGTLLGEGAVNLNTRQTLNNDGSTAVVQAAKALTIQAAAMRNSGTVRGQQTSTLTLASLDNQGKLLSGDKLTLTATGTLANQGQLYSGKDLSLNAAEVLNQGANASVQAKGALRIDTGGKLDNSGQLLADGTLTVQSGGNINNDGMVQAGGNLDLRGAAFTQGSNGKLLGKAATNLQLQGQLNNAGWLQSQGSLQLRGSTLENRGQIIGRDNVALSAFSGDVVNLGTGALLQAGKTLEVRASGNLTNEGQLLASQRLDLTVDSGALRNQSGALMQAGNDLRLRVATLLDNRGSVLAGGAADLIALNSAAVLDNSGSIQASAGLDIGQGEKRFASVSNHGQGLIKGQRLRLSAAALQNEGQDDSHKARIEAGTSSTLTVDSLYNKGQNAVMLLSSDESGTSASSVTVKNSLNNEGVIHGNGDVNASAADIRNSNTAGFSSLGKLALTATSGNVVNDGALYAGELIDIRAQNGEIRNSTSGTINSEHDIVTNSRDFLNQGEVNAVDNVTITASNSFRNETEGAGGVSKKETLLVIGGAQKIKSLWEEGSFYSGGDVDVWEETVQVIESLNGNMPQKKAQILATGKTGKVSINYGNSGLNNVALISAANIAIAGSGTFTNRDLALYNYTFKRQWLRNHDCWVSGFGSDCSTRYWAKVDPNADLPRHPSDSDDAADYSNPGAGWVGVYRDDGVVRDVASLSNSPQDRQKSGTSISQRFGSGVYGTTVSFSGGTLVNEGAPYKDATADNTKTAWDESKKIGDKTTVNASQGSGAVAGRDLLGGISVNPELGNTGKLSGNQGNPVFDTEGGRDKAKVNPAGAVALNGIDLRLPANPNGYFVPSKNSGSKYLVEGNPLFTRGGRYVGSDFLYERLGGNPEATQKRLGDAAYEAYLVRQQLISQTQNNVLKGYGNEEAQLKRLYEQAAEQSSKLGLKWGSPLSEAQKAKLDRDIVWMEEQVVNGERVLVPMVYLAQATRDSLDKGAVIAASDLSVEGAGFQNTGGTVSGDKLKVKVAGDIVNTSGTIKGGDVSLTSTGGSVINQTLATSRGNDISMDTDIGQTASIQSSGKLALDAAKDISIIGADVTGKNIDLTAKGNVTVDTIVDRTTRSTSETSSSMFGGSKKESTTSTGTNIGSNLGATGKLNIKSGGDTTIAGSNVKAGTMGVDAGGSFNVLARQDTSSTKTSSSESGLGVGGGMYGSTTTTTETFDGKNKGSKLDIGGDINVKAGKDMVLQGSELNAGGNASIEAKDIKVLDGLDEHRESTRTETTTFGKFGGSSDSNADANLKGGKASADAKADGELTLMETTVDKRSSGSTSSVASKLNVGGNLKLKAEKDITVQGSEITAGGDVDMKATNINVLAGRNTTWEESSNSTKSLGLYAEAGSSADAATGTASAEVGVGVKMHGSESSSSKGSVSSVGSVIKAGGNLNRTASGTITDQAATIEAGGDINQKAKEIRSLAGQNESWENSSSSSHTLKVGAHAEASAGKGGAEGMAGGRARYDGQMDDSSSRKSEAVTSNYKAGGNFNSKSEGKTTLQGSDITAGGNARVEGGSVISEAARNTESSSSSNTSINVDAKLGVDQSGAPTGSLDAGAGHTRSKSESSKAVTGSIKGGNVQIVSSGDVTLEGTNIQADNKATIDAAGKVDLKAARNTSSSSTESVQADLSVSATKGQKGGKTEKSGSLSAEASTQRESASEAVTGSISAGKGGIDIRSGQKATLEGTQLDSGGKVVVKGAQGTELKEAVSTSSSTDLSLKGSVSKKSGGDEGGKPAADGKAAKPAAKPATKKPATKPAASKASAADEGKADDKGKEDDANKAKKSVSGSLKRDSTSSGQKVTINADGPVEIGK